MFTKISVLIPTRHRIGRLQTLLTSYAQTVDDPSASELVFRVDEDDVETQAFLASYTTVVGPRYQGYLSLPTFFNEMLTHASGDVLMCGNDDMVFKTHGWAQAILAAANMFADDGLFDIGVTSLNELHYPFSTISKRAAERLGFIWDPRIFWGDIFLRDVMAAFGRCVLVPSVEISHDWAGHRPDQVFNEGNAERFLPRGSEYWVGVHQPAVNDAVERLRGLQA